VREYSIDDLMRRVCDLWERPWPGALLADGDAAGEVLAEHGFDPAVAGMAVVWGGDFFSAAMALLEVGALMGLSDGGASGDFAGMAEDVRFAADVLRMWADALDERATNECVVEAAEEAAGMSLPDELSVEERAAQAASFAQARRDAEVRRDDALDRRRSLIDVFRAEREREVATRLATLGAE
jgi:hypothetical protein